VSSPSKRQLVDEIQLPKESELLWIDIVQPTEACVEALAQKYKLHPLTQEDCITEEREKWERFENYVFLVVHDVNFTSGEWEQIDEVFVKIILFENVIISLHSQPIVSLPKIIFRVHQRIKVCALTPDWVMYVILDEITALFIPEVAKLVEEVEALDDIVLMVGEGDHSELLKRITQTRRRLSTIRRKITSKRDIYAALANRSDALSIFISQTVRTYLRDVYDDVVHMIEKTEASRDNLNIIHNSYLTQQQMYIAINNFQISDLMKKMSAYATILLPMSVLTGLMGMNVTIPGSGNPTLYWFFGIVAFMIIYAIACVAWFKRLGFL